MEDGIPKQIGRYDIERILGAGAMGFVYLGRDPELDRQVAVKTLRDLGMARDVLETFLERFRNEARAAARLQHPAIVQVYDVGDDPAVGPYVVFEYVAGSTLKQVLRTRGPLTPTQVVLLADQIADALDLAHHEGIIHRDIKPDNLLVTESGRTKLADFGVARVPNAALTREGQFLGTPCYAAPETLAEGEYGPRSDLFLFGAVLYESASGSRAFPGDDAVAVAHKVIHDEPPPLGEVALGDPIPEAVEDVIMRAISKRPAERYSSAAELARELRAAYVDAGVVDEASREPSTSFHTRPAPIPVPVPRSGGGNLAFVAVLLGLLAVGVAVVVAFSGHGFGEAVDGDVDAGLLVEAYDAGAPPVGEILPVVVDSGVADAGPESGSEEHDAGADAGSELPLGPHEREEAAKDAIDRARDAVAAGNWAATCSALAEARRLDPENGDISVLLERVPNGCP